MPHVPFAFEFESERPNSNLATKQLSIYHLAMQTQTVLLLNYHLAVRHDMLCTNLIYKMTRLQYNF